MYIACTNARSSKCIRLQIKCSSLDAFSNKRKTSIKKLMVKSIQHLRLGQKLSVQSHGGIYKQEPEETVCEQGRFKVKYMMFQATQFQAKCTVTKYTYVYTYVYRYGCKQIKCYRGAELSKQVDRMQRWYGKVISKSEASVLWNWFNLNISGKSKFQEATLHMHTYKHGQSRSTRGCNMYKVHVHQKFSVRNPEKQMNIARGKTMKLQVCKYTSKAQGKCNGTRSSLC